MRGTAQEEARRMRLLSWMSPGAYTSNLATNESINEALREHGFPPRSLDLSTAYASDLPTPATVGGVDTSENFQLSLMTPDDYSVGKLMNRDGLLSLNLGSWQRDLKSVIGDTYVCAQCLEFLCASVECDCVSLIWIYVILTRTKPSYNPN